MNSVPSNSDSLYHHPSCRTAAPSCSSRSVTVTQTTTLETTPRRPRRTEYSLTLTSASSTSSLLSSAPSTPSRKGARSARKAKQQSKSTLSSPSKSNKIINTTNTHTNTTVTRPKSKHSKATSLLLVFLVTLVTESAKGLFIPSLLPSVRRFLHSSSSDAALTSLGTLTACFPLGRLIATLPMGMLTDRFPPLSMFILTLLIQASGHLLYAVSGSLSALHVARVIVGMGSTTTNLARTHIALCVAPDQRTAYYAYIGALQFAGAVVVPVLGSIVSGMPSVFSAHVFNACTYPAYLLFVLCVVSVVSVYHVYECEPYTKQQDDTESAAEGRGKNVRVRVGDNKSSTSNDDDDRQHLLKPVTKTSPASLPATTTKSYGSVCDPSSCKESKNNDFTEHRNKQAYAIIVTCLAVNVCARSVMSVLETVSVPFLHEQFSLSLSLSSLCVSALGLLGVLTFLLLRPLSQTTTDRSLLRGGLWLLCVPIVLLVTLSGVTTTQGTWVVNVYVLMYTVCLGTAWSVGAPVAQTATLALFSKAVMKTGLPVGGFISVFSACGAVAPLGAVIGATRLWASQGRRAVFIALAVVAGIGLVLVVKMYERLSMRRKEVHGCTVV